MAAALLAAPVGVPGWLPALFAATAGLELLVVSRERYTDMEPLIGTSTAIRRQLPWWRPVAVGVPALLVAVAMLAVPLPGAYDVRRFVSADVVVVADENPLATAARLRRDAPASAEGTDVVVDVDGASPGRLRLAVLDEYEPAGWRQGAEFAVTGRVVTPGPLDAVEDDSTTTMVDIEQGEAITGLRAAPTAGSPVEIVDPNGVRYASSTGMFVTTDPDDGVEYRTVPGAEAAPPGAASAPARCARRALPLPRVAGDRGRRHHPRPGQRLAVRAARPHRGRGSS